MHSSKVVATLRADGSVAMDTLPANHQQSNLLHYEIRTESELLLKKSSALGATTVVDLGKQLLQCARDSDVAGVKAALAHGAPFASDWLGMSALHFAAMNNQLEICEILLQGGINMDAKTKVDRTPLHLACYYGHERIVSLLLALKCAVNSRDMLRMTPLHWAVERKHKTIARMLLKCHADVTLVSKFGKTPIALAVLTEQADILSELEEARKTQAFRKFSEETEKETSEAVNSIMDDSKIARSSDDADMSVEDKMDVLENLRGRTNMLGNSASLKMLKSHGIADMMQDNQIDDEASKKMLNTALRNGRQLVLSEGGRMLLHETNRSSKPSTNGVVAGNSLRKTVLGGHHNPSPPKIRMNVIKQKESPTGHAGGITKNKNIRIISLTDFKKLCDHPKSIQKIPATLASSGVVRQLADGTKLVNMRQLQSRQLKLPSLNRPLEGVSLDDETISVKAIHNPAASSSLRGQVGTVQTIQLRPSTVAGTAVAASINGVATNSGHATQRPGSRSVNETNANPSKSVSAMPLLTSSEICRQLHELRRQNEDLRRRVEVLQKEKEAMLTRVDRLEQLVLARDTDDAEMQFVDI
ncbi:poly [ADP-ribose] polymerase tankyrase-1 isoform X2 [Drosophila busckii]|uniref:poly [ADP-ribose] polymerase tankyrase-1 isoform X2 n=1 Tax=Drosophila busckii TaxID=30019 RepID=UPI00083EA8A5|nr:poly [ADP-ribose] polymerase tankyrase-1 isoform X2 [Drosophila busckii]